MDIFKKSIEVIRNNQSENGAYVASPMFDIYHFCWLRDGSYIAYAMDIAEQHDSAARFYSWVHEVICRYDSKMDTIIEKLKAGEKLDNSDFLYARYTLSGYDEKEEGWGNFQLDGYGTWLWGLAMHIDMTGNTSLLQQYKESIECSIQYIANLWHYPNFDIWEENSDKIHTSTLACLYGGLTAMNKYLNDDEIQLLANRIKTFILTNCVVDNHFVKYIGTHEVDSSLVWLGVPFEVVALDNPLLKSTIEKIKADLVHSGGTHRFKNDTYYGGGEWLLLSSWIGWYAALCDNLPLAKELKEWVEKQSDIDGNLPEQVCKHVNNEIYHPYWINKWGEVASPLLWSHAMYIVLVNVMEAKGEKQ